MKHSLLRPLQCLAMLLALLAGTAQAQFSNTPQVVGNFSRSSEAETPLEYRNDGARHIYAAYAPHIYKGKMPPLLYGIAITETEIDADGRVVYVRIVRKPAAPEVGPWVVSMIKNAGKYPPPARMGHVRYTEIWLVHKSGKFQLDTLTEGQY